MSMIHRKNIDKEEELTEPLIDTEAPTIESYNDDEPKAKPRRKYTVTQKRLESLQRAREAKQKKREERERDKNIDTLVEQRVQERLKNMDTGKAQYRSKSNYDIDITDIIY